jgi:fructose-bisphosphate aldolase class II
LETSVAFIDATGVDVFAPSIGNAHGSYKVAPKLDFTRVSDLVEARAIPIALHGGSGLSDEQFQDLISRGCAKVNISTALKELYMKSSLEFLNQAQQNNTWNPPSLFSKVREDVVSMTVGLAEVFGSAGKA